MRAPDDRRLRPAVQRGVERAGSAGSQTGSADPHTSSADSSQHGWDLTPSEAILLQKMLREKVIERDRLGNVRRVAGADVAYDEPGGILHAAVVVLDAKSLDVIEISRERGAVRFPYLPGLLSFREAPGVLAAFSRLSRPPDLLICDAQGRAHPRRFGLACHVGVLLDLQTIGCAKTLLVGEHREPGLRRGSHAAIRRGGEVIGEAVRTRHRVRPVFVSVGHRITLARARRWILALAPRFRLPEPIRAADAEARRMRRDG